MHHQHTPDNAAGQQHFWPTRVGEVILQAGEVIRQVCCSYLVSPLESAVNVPSILEELAEGHYVAVGAYVRNVPPHRALPAECFLDVTHASKWVSRAAGTYRHHVGATSYPIEVALTFDQNTLGLGTFVFRSAHTDEVAGTLVWIGGAYCLLGQSATVIMSGRLQPIEGRSFLVEGMLRFPEGRIHAFSLELRSEANRGSLGNIVPMPMSYQGRS